MKLWAVSCCVAAAVSMPVYRGANYIRLSGPVAHSLQSSIASQRMVGGGGYHSTFSPLFYNTTRDHHMQALQDMASNGYTLLRVFLDKGDCSRTDSIAGDPSKDILSASYMDNVADFVKIASDLGMKLMPTFELIPCNTYFQQMLQPPLPDIDGVNAQMLHPGGVKAKAEYISQFIKYAKSRLSAKELETIAVYSIENEACFHGDQLPFSSTTLQQVKTANGLVYNMSDPDSRQQCADANAVNWADKAFASVASGHPSALATVGMFTFQAVGKTGPNGLMPQGADPRFPVRPASLSKFSTASFLDVHVYPMGASSWTLSSDLATSEWGDIDFERTPVMMGEFGGFKAQFPSLESASLALLSVQAQSCQSFNFSSWLVWTWDSDDAAEQPELWSAVDANATQPGGVINAALSPKKRPDPCKP